MGEPSPGSMEDVRRRGSAWGRLTLESRIPFRSRDRCQRWARCRSSQGRGAAGPWPLRSSADTGSGRNGWRPRWGAETPGQPAKAMPP